MIALAVAIVLGLVAVYVANIYISGSKQQQDLQGTTKVAVASVPMAFGTELTPDKVRFVDYPKASIPPGAYADGVQLLPAGQKRFTALKAWRAEVAKEHNLPAYVVFHDATLAEMARECPVSLEALSHVTGVGAKKLDAYGSEILRVLEATA